MRKTSLSLLFILFTIAASLGSGLWVAFHLSELRHSPLEQKVPFFFPFLTALDKNGRSYVSDTATRRILALDTDGTLRWTLEGGKRKQGFYYAHQLAVDGEDRLYVYNWLPFSGTDLKAEEVQIQRYTPEGQLERTVFRLKNGQESEDFPAYFSFFIQNEALYTITGDGSALTLFRSDLDGENVSTVRSLPSGIDFVSIAGQADGTLYGVARGGGLFQAPPGQLWEPLRIPGVRKPWDVKASPDGALLILDLLQGVIFRFQKGRGLSALLTTKQTQGVFADTFSLSPSGGLAVADKEGQRLLISEPGQDIRAFEGARLSVAGQALRWSVWSALVLGALFALASLVLIYVFWMHRRLPLLLIQLLIFVPIVITAQTLAFNQVYDALSKRYQAQVRDALLNSAALVSQLLPTQDILDLHEPADLDSAAYARLKAVAKEIQKQGEETGAFNFIAIYRLIDGQPCYVYTGSGTFGVNYPYTLLPAQSTSLFTVAGTHYSEYFDDYGLYDSAFASIVGADGKPVAVVEVGLFADLIKDTENVYLSGARIFALGSGGLFIILFSVLTLVLLKSLGTLRRMTREIAQGNLDLQVELKTRDEIGQLGKDFGSMSRRLKSYLGDITSLTAASARFVPRDFIDLLGVQDLTELKLGDQTSREMTVLFSSVINFRKVTGHLSPQAVFQYLNSYLASTVPLIRTHSGIVDKFIGDTYMALFPSSPEDAVKSYQEIHRRIRMHNAKRTHSGSESLRVSFGIHNGPLMLGIVGEAQRLEGTVIADAVNLTSRLNGLCRIYGVSCVISFTTIRKIPRQTFRRLDYVMVKGKTEPVLICEPLDPSEEGREELFSCLDDYETAFSFWEKGDLEPAAQRFAALAQRLPDDPVVRRHRERIQRMLGEALPSPWSPAVKITEK